MGRRFSGRPTWFDGTRGAAPRHAPLFAFAGAWVAADTSGLLGHVVLHRPTGDADASWVCAAAALPPERTAMVSRLFVASRARGAEVGVDLLQTVVREASARGPRTALAVAESDRAARALYECCGWQHVDSTPWTWSGGGRTVLHCFSVQR